MKRFFRSREPFTPSPARALMSYILLAIWTVIALFPFYWLFITAFKSRGDIDGHPTYLPFIDFHPTIAAFQELFGEGGPGILRPYLTTIVVATTTAVVTLIIGSAASYALARLEYRPKRALVGLFMVCVFGIIIMVAVGVPWFFSVVIGVAIYLMLALTIGKRFKGTMNNSDITFWLISQRMLPPVAVILPIYIMFQQLHLLDTLVALIIAYTASNLPLVIWLMRDYFMSLPIELEECAFIDGATRLQVLSKIVLPLSTPGLVATFLIILVFSWNEYVVAVFLTSANAQTMPILVAGQNATRGPQWQNISVLVMMMIIPIVIMAIVLEKYIVRGILVGAVKG